MANALLFIGSTLSIVGAIWLLVVAFRDSLPIGLGTLLVPFFAIYTIVRNWPDTKVPLLLGSGGVLFTVLSIPLAPQVAMTSFSEQPEVTWSEKRNVRGGPVTGPLAEARSRALENSAENEEQTADTESTQPATGVEPKEPTRRSPPGFQRRGDQRGQSFPAERIGDFVDRYITVVCKDGERILGTVERVDSKTVTLRRRIGGGTISFQLDRHEIHQLLVPRRIQ